MTLSGVAWLVDHTQVVVITVHVFVYAWILAHRRSLVVTGQHHLTHTSADARAPSSANRTHTNTLDLAMMMRERA
jgi:hypothetical protein